MLRFDVFGTKIECDTGQEACDLVLAITKDDLHRRLFTHLNQAITVLGEKNKALQEEIERLSQLQERNGRTEGGRG